MAEPDSKAKEPDAKPPTAEDLKKLQSTYDQKLAAKDKELEQLKAGKKKGDPAVEDDLAVQEAAAKLTKEREDFETGKVTWNRARIAAEYGVPVEELKDFTDVRDMELYAIKKKGAAKVGAGAKPGADREPGQAGSVVSPNDRLRSGLEKRFKTLFPA